MAAYTLDLGDHTSSGVKTAVTVPGQDLSRSTVFVYGTFVATWRLEVSPDGSNWIIAREVANATALNARSTNTPESWVLGGAAHSVRLNVTAYTSGTISCRVLVEGGR